MHNLELFYMLAEQTTNGIILTDADKRIIYVNKAFTISTGYSYEEALGKNPSFLQSGYHDLAFYKQLWSSIRIKGQWQGEIWNKRKNGEIFIEWQNIMALRNERGDITHYGAVFSDITERKRIETKLQSDNKLLKRQIHTDSLTGVHNRRYFDESLKRRWKSLAKTRSYLSLLLIDVDYFKEYNDLYGHLQGDSCLREAAGVLAMRLPRSFRICRYGGEEFAVLLPGLSASETYSMAELLRESVHQHAIPHGHSKVSDRITVSIGGATVVPKLSVDPEHLVQLADEALYTAKQNGRNRILCLPVTGDRS